MKFLNADILSAVDTASANGNQIDASQLYIASFHAVFGDATAVGTIKVQASNDIFDAFYLPGFFTVTNWVDIASASVNVTAGGQVLIPPLTLSYRWIRVVYTRTSGGSTVVNVNMQAQAL